MNGFQQPQMLPQPKSKTWLWVIIGVVVVLVVLIGWYYYSYAPAPAGEIGGPAEVPEDVSDLEGELQAATVEGLDAELGDIEKELSQ